MNVKKTEMIILMCPACLLPYAAKASLERYREKAGLSPAKYCSNACRGKSQQGSYSQEQIIAGSLKDEQTGCWLWQRTLNDKGYGVYGNVKGKRCITAHRVSYRMFKGEIPKGSLVRHRCDVPACVNPDHLDIGTHSENMRDCVERGRMPRGDTRKQSVLREMDIPVIRGLFADGVSQSEIGRRLGVSNTTIWSIVRLKTWGHVL